MVLAAVGIGPFNCLHYFFVALDLWGAHVNFWSLYLKQEIPTSQQSQSKTRSFSLKTSIASILSYLMLFTIKKCNSSIMFHWTEKVLVSWDTSVPCCGHHKPVERFLSQAFHRHRGGWGTAQQVWRQGEDFWCKGCWSKEKACEHSLRDWRGSSWPKTDEKSHLTVFLPPAVL